MAAVKIMRLQFYGCVATSRFGIFDLKSVPGNPNLGLLESGVKTKMPKLDHLETRELQVFGSLTLRAEKRSV